MVHSLLDTSDCRSIAAATAHAPPLVVADEPTDALDVTTAAGILHLLRATGANGTAIVMVSHGEAALGVLADRVLRMDHGAVQAARTAQQVDHEATGAWP